MKEILTQLAEYNVWASQRLSEIILNLSEEQQEETLPSSFEGLKKTLQHMWEAENIWWQRLQLVENVIITDGANSSTTEVANNLFQQDKQLLEWVKDASEAAIDHVFSYQNSKKEQFKQPVYQVLFHLFNHNTYHRGQIVTMFHQLGITKIPSTDFILFLRTFKPTKQN